jgi:hypothetical protein
MSAEEDRSGRAVEEPGPYNMANRTFENVTIIPLIAPKDSFGQTFEKLTQFPLERPGALACKGLARHNSRCNLSHRGSTLPNSSIRHLLFACSGRDPTPRTPATSVTDCSAAGQRSGARAASEMRNVARMKGSERICTLAFAGEALFVVHAGKLQTVCH